MAGLTAVLIIAAAVLVLLAICFVCAALAGGGSRTAGGGAAPAQADPPPIDPARAEAYADHLSRMIRCETLSNPDGATSPAFAALREVMEECYPRTHASCERTLFGDAQLLRWPGRDPLRGAIVLMAHLDVVPAGGQWTHPPFAGQIEDGRVFGRGAIDDKGALCAVFEAVEGLIERDFVPLCDVYLVSSDNEEIMAGGAPAIRDFLVSKGVRFEMVVDEGGAVGESPLPGLPGLFAMMGIVEKGVGNLRFTARSAGGHASVPPKNTPVARLAAFVDEIERRPPFAVKIGPALRATLRALAPYMSFAQRLLLCNLWLLSPFAKRWLAKRSPRLSAMMRTTCAFTMQSGGTLPNIIPGEATLVANVRFAPHQPMAPSIAAIRKVADRHGLDTEVFYTNEVSYGVDLESPAFAYAKECVQKAFPEAAPLPIMVLFGTDSRQFAPHCDCTLRFSPYIAGAGELARMHAEDESLSVHSLARAVKFYEILLRDYR